MLPPPPCAGAAAGKARVVEVWAHNEEAELAHISGLFRDFPIAVVATSKDVPCRPVPAPPTLIRRLWADDDGFYRTIDDKPFLRSLDYNCERIGGRVRGSRFLQIALALLNRDGDLALGRVWRFHLGLPSADDERFMVELGVEPSVRRADRGRFARALVACRAVKTAGVTWVTSDGAEHVAHLLDCFLSPDGRRRPIDNPDHHTLIRLSRSHFWNLYDLRLLAEWRTLAGEDPPLLAAATSPDALLRGFLALMREPTFAERMVGYNGILSGLGHYWDTPDLDRCRLSIQEQERLLKMTLVQLHGGKFNLENFHLH